MKDERFIYKENRKGKEIVKQCIGNIAKMSVLEYVWYNTTQWGFFGTYFRELGEQLLEWGSVTLITLLNFFATPFLPILLPIQAYYSIKNAKKDVRNNARQRGWNLYHRYRRARNKANLGDYTFTR